MNRALILLPLLLAGCSLDPKDVRPETAPVPPSWPAGDAYLRSSEAALPAVAYRDVFRDPRLQAIIERALANNRDLRIAADNIAVARAQYRIQRSEIFPDLTASGTYSYSRGATRTGTITGNGGAGTGTGGTGTGGTGTGGTGTGGTGTGGSGATTTTGTNGGTSFFTVQAGVTAFEIDLFGRLQSLTRAELNEYFATEAAQRTTRLTLVANVAGAWLTYAADQSLLAIARQTAESAERSVRLTRARLEGGIAPRTDLRQAETVLETARADLARQTTAVAQDANLLRLLVGADVEAALLPQDLASVANSFSELPAGLDSQILLRRPDIVQAEYRLRAANAQIGAARAAMFPRITLTGLVGFASTALRSLFDGDNFTYQVAPNVDVPIFDFGGRQATLAQARANRQLLLDTYEQTIQTAFREVADALARRGTVTEEERATRAQVDAAADTFRLTDARYRGGIDPFLNSLDAQRTLYAAQQRLVAIQLERAQNLVTVYQTLGGDATLEATSDGPRALSPEPTSTPTPPVR